MRWPMQCGVLPLLLVSLLGGCGIDSPDPAAPPLSLDETALDGSDAVPDSMSGRVILWLRPQGRSREDLADTLVQAVRARKRAMLFTGEGFVLDSLRSKTALAWLRAHPLVASVEPDRDVIGAETQNLSPGDEEWALDQIDQRTAARDFKFNYFYKGSGVHIYILDTGIRADHTQFTGRVGSGRTFLVDHPTADAYQPIHAHGTNMAGAAAGTRFGVAKQAIIHSIRIAWDTPIAKESDTYNAMNWLRLNAQRPAVVSFSYSTSALSVKNAIDGLIQAGIPVVVAAGNDNMVACNIASNTAGLSTVVGAVDRQRLRWPSSNYGACVDLYAPGVVVRTANHTSSGAEAEVTGTSIAAALTAGVAATIVEQLAVKEPGGSWGGRAHSILALSATPLNPAPSSPNSLLNSLHRYIDHYTGPTSVNSATTTSASWSALKLWGGNGTWTNLRWMASVNGGSFVQVGTGSTYTRPITSNADYSMILRLTGTSFSDTSYTVGLGVTVEPPDPTPPPPDDEGGGGGGCNPKC